MTSTALLLHVAHGFSAQPTIAAQLAARSDLPWRVLELEPAEVLQRDDIQPDVVWASRPQPEVTRQLRHRLPGLVVQYYDLGADLVIEDEGITYAAAAVAALGRRLPVRTAPAHAVCT
jgi:hypothetical protein